MKKNDVRKNDSPEVEINIIPLLKYLLQKLWLIALVGFIVGGSVFVSAKIFIRPTYRSSFTAYVNNKPSQKNNDYLSSSDVYASKELVLTYQKILTSNTILTASAQSIGIDKPYTFLKNRVSTEVKDETEIITVYVVDTDPQVAYNYAQAISKTAPKYLAEIVEGSSMKIIDYPELSKSRYQPNYFQYGLIGFIAAAAVVVILLIIRFFMDDTVKAEGDIESRFSIPILGVIPDVSKATGNKSGYYYYASEAEDKQSEGEPKDEEK